MKWADDYIKNLFFRFYYFQPRARSRLERAYAGTRREWKIEEGIMCRKQPAGMALGLLLSAGGSITSPCSVQGENRCAGYTI